MSCCGEKRSQLRLRQGDDNTEFPPLDSFAPKEYRPSFMYLGEKGVSFTTINGNEYDIKNSLDVVFVDEIDLSEFLNDKFLRLS